MNGIGVEEGINATLEQASISINLIIPDLAATDVMTIEISGNDATDNQQLLVFNTTFRLELIAAS